MGVRAGLQVSKRELYTHIHLDWAIVEFLSCKKKKNNKKKNLETPLSIGK